MLVNALLGAVLNVAVLAVLPFAVYCAYHKLRHRRAFAESARRAGLCVGERKYIAYGVALAALAAAVIALRPPELEPFTREGSAQRAFVGLGLSGTSVAMALLYGFVKTGFPEELLFRGLIAGSLARRMPFLWANLLQSLIFLAPHLVLLKVMPEMWAMLVIVFAAAQVAGWLRIRSGSIVAPWIVHATANVAISVSVAVRSA
jgi:membrane protease YdiL (CAAX protease family)